MLEDYTILHTLLEQYIRVHKSCSQVTMISELIMVACNICGFSVHTLLHVMYMAPRIFKWLLDFCKNFASL